MSEYLEMKNGLASLSWVELMKDFLHELMKFPKVDCEDLFISLV